MLRSDILTVAALCTISRYGRVHRTGRYYNALIISSNIECISFNARFVEFLINWCSGLCRWLRAIHVEISRSHFDKPRSEFSWNSLYLLLHFALKHRPQMQTFCRHFDLCTLWTIERNNRSISVWEQDLSSILIPVSCKSDVIMALIDIFSPCISQRVENRNIDDRLTIFVGVWAKIKLYDY